MTVDEAIRIAKAEAKDPYARSYLEALPDSIEESGSEGFKTQLLYALNNMKTWRGDRAREVKKVLLSYAKNPRKGMHTMYARVVNIRNELSNKKCQVVVSRKSGRAFTDEQFKKAWNTGNLDAAGWALYTTYEALVVRGIKVNPKALEVGFGLDHIFAALKGVEMSHKMPGKDALKSRRETALSNLREDLKAAQAGDQRYTTGVPADQKEEFLKKFTARIKREIQVLESKLK